MPSVDVLTKTLIARPIEAVAAFAADPDNVPAWYVNIQSVEWKTPRPLVLGSKLAFKARFLGREMAYTYEVVEFEPKARLVMRTAEGPFPMETTYEWQADSESATIMSLRNRGTPSGFAKWTSPVMAAMVRRANRKDLALLKKVLETADK